MAVLVCIDRDGTINRDVGYLGKDDKWKSHVEILPGVFEGLRMLNSVHGLRLFIITNQSGVALAGPEFKALNENRVNHVNNHIISLLKDHGITIEGCFFCPYVDKEYLKKAEYRGYGDIRVHSRYLRNGNDERKPGIGMLIKAASSINMQLDDFEKIFFIGDRASDVLAGINAGGIGVYVPKNLTEGHDDRDAVLSLSRENPGKVFIAKGIPDAAEMIIKCAD